MCSSDPIADFRALTGRDFLYLSTYEEMEGNEDGEYMFEFYGRHGFGAGERRSGVMIYLDLYNNNYYVQNFGDMDDYMSQEGLDAVMDNCDVLMGEARILDAVLQVIDAYSAAFR